MADVALVSYDVQTVGGRAGGVGAFVTHFARLLTSRGERVTIVLVSGSPEPARIDPAWKARYAGWNIALLEVSAPAPRADRWREAWPARLSEHLAPRLLGFDIVYFQDWANAGFHSIRQKRFSRHGPVMVTVLHGPSPWIRSGNRKLPNITDDLHIEYIERYGAQHSDWVIAPSRYMSTWLKQHGWTFPREPEVLGLPYLPEEIGYGVNAGAIERIVMFGRLETRKGFDLFRDALRLGVGCDLKEIVLLGREQEAGSVDQLRRELSVTLNHIGDLDSAAAIQYLAGCANNTLVVIPSPFENFPYAVVEALSIRGLNVICSRGGGIPEVFGGECEAQLFDPTPQALAAKIAERIARPLRVDRLATYDHEAANARWIAFHERACSERPGKPKPRRASVDVCIPYYNKGRYLPQLLAALETQGDIGVIVIDDGSTDTESRQVFDNAARAYASRNWKFVRQENAFVDAARNRAAAMSAAEYLLFIDADDVPAEGAIERLVDAAVSSGVDCLLSGGYLFDSGVGYMPLGPDLLGGMVDPMVLGLPMILIRGSVFQKVGGYREVRGAGHEDWEMQVRLLRGGFETDVLPEHLLYFRRAEDGLSRTGEVYPAKRRLIEAYEEPLRAVGMCGLAGAVFSLNERCFTLQEQLRENVPLELRMRLHALQS
jgi:glycosyltransferase involved in cell wall biosynthesis/GT2 family glycosyltransferase